MNLNPEFQVDGSVAIQLREQGLTGLRYLEIDTVPENLESLTPKIGFEPEYPLIPSYPSEIEQLKEALVTIYEKFTALDLQSLVDNWTQTAQSVNSILGVLDGAIEPEDWKQTVQAVRKTAEESAAFMTRLSKAANQKELNEGFKDLSATLEATKQASEALAGQFKSLPPDAFSKMVKNWDDTFKRSGDLFVSVDKQLGESSLLFQQSLQQFKLLLIQLNALVQTLKEQPNRLLVPSKEPDPFTQKRR
jgi:phospholipid/cholesterol/gamma-HCH transport system substrate-binding protein